MSPPPFESASSTLRIGIAVDLAAVIVCIIGVVVLRQLLRAMRGGEDDEDLLLYDKQNETKKEQKTKTKNTYYAGPKTVSSVTVGDVGAKGQRRWHRGGAVPQPKGSGPRATVMGATPGKGR
ncbi:hypothetical protein EDB86DRAFT_2828055 [Lactarius hatsudake]|nr:hypothetical protein EDB86DRAFT_2828055 [Lactarius hatsudake]